MNRRPHLTLVALIVAGLIGVGLLAIPGSPLDDKPTLGLDLQGGLEVTLKAVPPQNRWEERLLAERKIPREVTAALMALPHSGSPMAELRTAVNQARTRAGFLGRCARRPRLRR